MAKSSDAEIRRLCTEMANAEAEGDYGGMLAAANSLISANPKGVPAHKCKLIALIQLGQFDEALKLIDRLSAHQLGDTTVEKAYILYRKNKNEEALEILKNADQSDPAALELKGQLLYRLNRFQEALDLYKKLCREQEDEWEDLRRANLLAVTSQLNAAGTAQEPTTSELGTYEQLYNHACHLISARRYEEALKVLVKAEKAAKESLEADGFTPEEIEDELTMMSVQRAYIMQVTNKTNEALDLYGKIQQQEPSDAALLKVVIKNYSTLKKRVKYEGFTQRKNQKRVGPAAETGTAIITGKLRTKKRKRPIRLPKNYDPNVAPDPERWLPKQERTGYKKKVHKKYKDRDVGRGTQGAAAGGNANVDAIDYSNKPVENIEVQQSPKPSGSERTTPRPQAARRQQQKKKKKTHW